MNCWTAASLSEKKQFEVISLILDQNQRLLTFLFDPYFPQLRNSPEILLKRARGLCSSDFLRIKICLDIWCEQGQVQVHELFSLEPDQMSLVLKGFSKLSS